MQILKAKYLFVMDEEFTILKDKAICFDEIIKEIGEADELRGKYPNASFDDLGDSLLMPGLINTHIHLEFSSNKGELKFGNFVTWLESIIQKRDELIATSKDGAIEIALKEILSSGTTTIGAISSFGLDLKPCVESRLNVVYFNEVLGSTPSAVDLIYSDFLQRLNSSKERRSDSFIPAVSIHSPYSTHPILAKKAISDAKKEGMIISTHFMESDAEREWLDRAEGEFRRFFESFLPNSSPMIEPLEYIKLFRGTKTLFTHCTKASDEEIEAILDQGGAITHCPRSNRYLGNGRLEIEKLANFHLATDGLSSNESLSLWDEMRGALMMHYLAPLEVLSKRLLKSVTLNAAKALGLKKGTLKEGYDSDLIVLSIPKGARDLEGLVPSLILYTNSADTIYIRGEKLK